MTVINLPEPLSKIAERIRVAFKKTQHGRQEWIEGTLELAQALFDGRARYQSNQAFAHWLIDEELDYIGPQDRAALISMAGNLPLAKTILQETQRSSWQHIWSEEMQPRLSHVSKMEIPPTPCKVIPITAPVEPKQTVAPEAPAKTEVHVPIKRTNHPFFGLSRAEEVAAIYCQSKTRLMVGNAIKKQRTIWPLILQLMDAGILRPSNAIREHPDLSILFPDTSLAFRRKYNLTKAGDLRAVKERIIPAALANRELVAAEPANIEDIIGVYWAQLQEKVNAERHASKIEAAMTAMKAAETEVILFGRRYWPIIEQQPHLTYDFATLRHAVWTFRELHTMSRLASDNSPASCGLRIRHAIKFLNGYADKTILWLLYDLSRALQTQPNGVEKLPDMPNLDKSYD